jgi:hypothetical protein
MFYATLMQDGYIWVEDTILEGTVTQFRVNPEEALILRDALDVELNKKKRMKKNMQFVSKFVKNWAAIGFFGVMILLVINSYIDVIFKTGLDLGHYIIIGLSLIYIIIGESVERYTKHRLEKHGIL